MVANDSDPDGDPLTDRRRGDRPGRRHGQPRDRRPPVTYTPDAGLLRHRLASPTRASDGTAPPPGDRDRHRHRRSTTRPIATGDRPLTTAEDTQLAVDVAVRPRQRHRPRRRPLGHRADRRRATAAVDRRDGTLHLHPRRPAAPAPTPSPTPSPTATAATPPPSPSAVDGHRRSTDAPAPRPTTPTTAEDTAVDVDVARQRHRPRRRPSSSPPCGTNGERHRRRDGEPAYTPDDDCAGPTPSPTPVTATAAPTPAPDVTVTPVNGHRSLATAADTSGPRVSRRHRARTDHGRDPAPAPTHPARTTTALTTLDIHPSATATAARTPPATRHAGRGGRRHPAPLTRNDPHRRPRQRHRPRHRRRPLHRQLSPASTTEPSTDRRRRPRLHLRRRLRRQRDLHLHRHRRRAHRHRRP